MIKPKIYVIRPKTQWDVVELVDGREVRLIALCDSEKQAMAELENALREEAGVTKTPKRPRDPNQLAKLITDIATGENAERPERSRSNAPANPATAKRAEKDTF